MLNPLRKVKNHFSRNSKRYKTGLAVTSAVAMYLTLLTLAATVNAMSDFIDEQGLTDDYLNR